MSWFSNKKRCCDGGRQHNYSPRYTEKHPEPTRIQVGDMISTHESWSSKLAKVYIRDVCTWCGATIELVNAPPPAKGAKDAYTP